MSYRGTPFFQQQELTSVRRLRESVERKREGGPGSGPRMGDVVHGSGGTKHEVTDWDNQRGQTKIRDKATRQEKWVNTSDLSPGGPSEKTGVSEWFHKPGWKGKESRENGQTPSPGNEEIFACGEQAEALAVQCQKIPGCGPIVKQLIDLADKLHQVAGVQPDTPETRPTTATTATTEEASATRKAYNGK